MSYLLKTSEVRAQLGLRGCMRENCDKCRGCRARKGLGEALKELGHL